MNKVVLVGRLARDPEIHYTNEGSSVTRFAVAINRKYAKKGNKQEADFINCVTFGKTAEFVEKYFKKGNRIGLSGRIQTGNYLNKDNQKVYTTDVIVEEVEFVESKSECSSNNYESTDKDGFVQVDTDMSEELLFV